MDESDRLRKPAGRGQGPDTDQDARESALVLGRSELEHA
jgi:hypothetical protein